jgi:RNA polymerase sigma factor (sigma-70 family)
MQTPCQADLTRITHADLLSRCQRDLVRYQRGEPHDDCFGLELVRRAVVEQGDQAWEALRQLYQDRVVVWCRRAGADVSELDEFVQATWVRFWLHYTPAKLQTATGLCEVLAYLKLCARSTVLDVLRRQRAVTDLGDAFDLVDPAPNVEDECLADEQRARFWQLIDAHLLDQRERVLVQLTYAVGMRPAEVQAHRPDLFPTIQDVYRITRNVLDRLRRSDRLRAWFAQQHGGAVDEA